MTYKRSVSASGRSAAPVPALQLATGAQIPQLGFGTYLVPDDTVEDILAQALDVGYRHIDTAQMYKNEAGVGRALRNALDDGIERSELFVTTKLNNQNHGRDDALRSFDQSLENLGLDYVDLFLIHWPLPGMYDGRYDLTWQTMIEIFESGRAKAIGVSNFEPEHLRRIVDATGFVPHVNQVQAHPYFPNNESRDASRELGAVVEAWSPLGRGDVLGEPSVQEAAQRLGRSPSQIVLRWAVERGDVVFPKASSSEHMSDNFDIFDFKLDEDATRALNSLDRGEEGRRGTKPSEANFIVD